MTTWDHLIFDMDGVLVDSSPCHAEAFTQLWQHCGVQGPRYELIAGRPTREVVADYTAPLQPAARQLDDWVSFKQRRARTLIAERTILFPDTQPALQRLSANRYRLALATSASRDTMDLILAAGGLTAYFPVTVSADEVTRGKPAPDVYACVLRRVGAPADRCLVVEDSDAGIRAGLGAGIQVVSVRTGRTVDHPRFVGAFADLSTLVDYLAERAA